MATMSGGFVSKAAALRERQPRMAIMSEGFISKAAAHREKNSRGAWAADFRYRSLHWHFAFGVCLGISLYQLALAFCFRSLPNSRGAWAENIKPLCPYVHPLGFLAAQNVNNVRGIY